MSVRFFKPFYLLPALVALLCIAGTRSEAKQGHADDGDINGLVGDFGRPIIPKLDPTIVRYGPAQRIPVGPDNWGEVQYLPDCTAGPGESLKLWDEWHSAVANLIYRRFNTAAGATFTHSPSLTAQVSYMVASDGRIGNVRVLQPSENPVFNSMLVNVIKSIQGSHELEFPPGSQRQFVEKTGTFKWNYPGGCDTQPERPPNIGPAHVAK